MPSALCAWNDCFWAMLAPSQNVTLPSESEVTIVWSLESVVSLGLYSRQHTDAPDDCTLLIPRLLVQTSLLHLFHHCSALQRHPAEAPGPVARTGEVPFPERTVRVASDKVAIPPLVLAVDGDEFGRSPGDGHCSAAGRQGVGSEQVRRGRFQRALRDGEEGEGGRGGGEAEQGVGRRDG